MVLQTAGPIQYQRKRKREGKTEKVKKIRKDGKSPNKKHKQKHAPGSNM